MFFNLFKGSSSSELENYVFQKLSEKILSWDKKKVSSIYALSLYISDYEDDPRKPILTFGFNTMEQWKKSVGSASNEQEAKWNYAFWLQNEEAYIGKYSGKLNSSDESDCLMLKGWMMKAGLYYTDDEEKRDLDKALQKSEEITRQFVAVCLNVVKRLHKKVIPKLFQKPVPVLVHELEYYEEIAKQNGKTNPPETIGEFVKWVREL